MPLMAAQEDIFDTLREVAAFSREVEERNFRGGPPCERLQPLPCLLPAWAHLLFSQLPMKGICYTGGNEVDALTQMMTEFERQDDHEGAEGHGDLLDDFVTSALAPVGTKGCTAHYILSAEKLCTDLLQLTPSNQSVQR